MTASERVVAAGGRLDAEALGGKPTSLWRTTLRRLFQRRSAVVGMTILGILVAAAVLAPVIAPFPPDQVLIGLEDGIKKRSGPCIHLLGCPADQPEHILGVDGNVRDYECRWRKRSGEVVDVLLAGAAIDYEGRQVMLSTALDITERKRAEQLLRESESRFASFFQSSPVPVAIASRDAGRYVEVNDAWVAFFGGYCARAASRRSSRASGCS